MSRSNTSEKQLLVEELHASARKNFPRRRVIVRGYDDLWQADVVEMRPYSRSNKGYNYILTVIDVLSKYAWAVPLKSKSGNEMSETIAKIIRDGERCPTNFQTDRGKEFYNSNVQKVLKKHDINHLLRPVDFTIPFFLPTYAKTAFYYNKNINYKNKTWIEGKERLRKKQTNTRNTDVCHIPHALSTITKPLA